MGMAPYNTNSSRVQQARPIIEPLSKARGINLAELCSEVSIKVSLSRKNQYIDPKTGKTGIGNIRTTIDGIKNIQDYFLLMKYIISY